MKTSMKLAVWLVLATVFLALPAQAQENDGVATTVLITPKPGHDKQLVDAIIEYHHFVAQFEGHFEYRWYEVLTGPNTGKYAARSGGKSMRRVIQSVLGDSGCTAPARNATDGATPRRL